MCPDNNLMFCESQVFEKVVHCRNLLIAGRAFMHGQDSMRW